VVKSFGKFSPLSDQKKRKKGSANFTKELIFSKKAKSCYILRAKLKKKSRQQIPDLLGQIFFTTSADTKKKKKKGLCKSYKGIFFLKKGPKLLL
jgi:hypothetical protein